jgi:galactose mutarotase-like enzyme
MVETSRIGEEKENVLIRTGDCSLTLMPHLGGKIASLQLRGHELLQTPLAPYAPRTRNMSFSAGDASGWDECLPSVAGCTVDTANGPASVPDHGDLWRVAWQVVREQGTGNREQGSVDAGANSITLRGECFSLPLALERKLTLTQTEKGYRIAAEYKVTNTGTVEVPWSWSAHPGYLAEEGDTLHLPDSIEKLRIEWTRNDRLDKSTGSAAWPIAKLTGGGSIDLRISTPAHSGVGDKLFAGPLKAAENWVALERPKAGVRLRVSFDAEKTPYLGLWICQDGYPEGSGPQQHCVAMEPCTAPVDSLAITGPWSRTLAAGASYFWPMTIDLETI